LTSYSDLGVNALVTRQEDLQDPREGATIVKVKVGKDPLEDAKRVNSLSIVLSKQKGILARLRLDANQGWSVDEAVIFLDHLSALSVTMTEYLEEPVKWTTDGPASFLKSWEILTDRTRKQVSLAVDESLTDNALSLEHIADSKAPIVAIVLKPALQGIEQTFKIGAWSLKRGIRPVVSSAFESGVALCHFAILAANMAVPHPGSKPNQVSACHGLGTFTRLAEDVLDPPFADLIYHHHHSGWRVDTLRCQEALDRTVDALVAAKDPPSKAHAWC
jgi:O-succinylbenzoate synthase